MWIVLVLKVRSSLRSVKSGRNGREGSAMKVDGVDGVRILGRRREMCRRGGGGERVRVDWGSGRLEGKIEVQVVEELKMYNRG